MPATYRSDIAPGADPEQREADRAFREREQEDAVQRLEGQLANAEAICRQMRTLEGEMRTSESSESRFMRSVGRTIGQPIDTDRAKYEDIESEQTAIRTRYRERERALHDAMGPVRATLQQLNKGLAVPIEVPAILALRTTLRTLGIPVSSARRAA